MHNIDDDVHTTGPEEWRPDTGGGGFVEMATECAGNGPGSASLSAIGAAVSRGWVED
jgi:hypothetical protein